MIKQLSAAGAATTAAAIVTSSPAFAAGGSCCAANDFYTLIGSCVPSTSITNGCTTVFQNTISVCRPTPTTTMTMARSSTGLYRPFFDEVGVMTVTSPSGVIQTQNFIGYQNTCRDTTATLPDLTGFGAGNGSSCSPTSPLPATNVTPLFGNECGIFTVRIRARNGFTPFGYSTVYLRGS